MPSKPARVCYRCRRAVVGACPHCHFDKPWHSPDSQWSRGSTRAWRTMRARVLADYPLCQTCGDRPATMVDHIVPRYKGGPFLERGNLASICEVCHTAKTTRESHHMTLPNRVPPE